MTGDNTQNNRKVAFSQPGSGINPKSLYLVGDGATRSLRRIGYETP